MVVYVYIDKELAFKFHIKNTKQPINFDFELLPEVDAKMLRIEFYDPSESTNMDPDESEGDEDKDFYN